ncbi:relaxase/mobilization nuclease domain-containing protein [Pedobacter deserti]|uniref:relaxase/mobilization nuclease domain-containing protein n=1 Tax=Pedobacter deserti TaxID=2817382 RepID=UPI002108754B|nr:relaxase/mobilization nuclease domain-containing protein [Pedobacter sp. SYSU D00382]
MLHYNENKVAKGEASLILASGFAADIDGLDFNQKLQRFRHLTELKPSVKTNAVHVSLNFHSSEHLNDFMLQQIAGDYMCKIGFGDQPFLVYRHDDAAHQHLHITTTNITASGERIDLHNIGRQFSEPARKAIEIQFNLVQAESARQKVQAPIKKADFKQARYGKLPTKRAMSNVITAVSRDYAFTSLAEYNAALKCFNVVALRGKEGSEMFHKKGLIYSLTDAEGSPVGVPIKSSAFYCRATLRNLEKKFEKNNQRRRGLKPGIKARLDQTLQRTPRMSQKKFEQLLADQGIEAVFRRNAEGRVFGITFVDHARKAVFNGSDLGKAYSAQAIASRFIQEQGVTARITNTLMEGVRHIPHADLARPAQSGDTGILATLLKSAHFQEGIAVPKRKRKRRKSAGKSHELNL